MTDNIAATAITVDDVEVNGVAEPAERAPAAPSPPTWLANGLAAIGVSLEEAAAWCGLALLAALTRLVNLGGPPLNVEEGHALEFPTPSGKVEFWSSQLAERGFDPVPRYTPHPEPPPGHFRLLFGRSPVHTFSRTQTNPILHEAMPENEVWVHPDVVRRWGLENGRKVRLVNQDGEVSNPIKVKATERIRTDCVYLVHGFGHNAPGMTRAHNRGASDTALQTRYTLDRICGGAGLRVNFVRLVKEA